MKILCLNPSMQIPASWGKQSLPIHPPLGLAYVAGILQKNNDVKFLDANAEGYDEIKKVGDYYHSGLSKSEIVDRIAKINPEVICMTIVFTVNSVNALDILREVKKKFPKILAIVGGPHVTVRPEETLKNDFVDIIVIGEGEKTVEELFNCISKNGLNNDELGKIKGIGFKNNGEIKINEPREYIQNLDEVPFPPLELLPLEFYFKAHSQGKSKVGRGLYTFNDRWTTVITSRGCPMNCIFCSIHLSMGKFFRARSPENVVDEMERDYKQFGIRHFNLEDDNMTWNIERFKKICDLIIEKGLKITWSTPNGIRADRLDEELVKKMKLSGCRRVFVAPESGSQRVIDEIIDKKLKLQDVEKAVELLSKNGIIVDASFVIGFPGETKKEIWESIYFAKKLRQKGATMTYFNIATPLYGTRLYDEVVKKGYFDANTDPSTLGTAEAHIQTPEWTKEEILSMREMAVWYANYSSFKKLIYPLKKFLLQPSKIPHYVIAFITNSGRIRGEES